MTNIASALKSEITRLCKKAIKQETASLRASSARQRKDIALLKKEAQTLKRQIASAGRETKKSKVEITPDSKLRFRQAGLINHRKRLKLSAKEYGKLLGVSEQTVYNWEGGKRPSQHHLIDIAKLRLEGARELKARLKNIG